MNTPHEIEVALNAYYSPQPFSPNSPALPSAQSKFLGHGIMEIREANSYGKTHFLTIKGEAWVRMLCQTPFPQEAFINPATKEII